MNCTLLLQQFPTWHILPLTIFIPISTLLLKIKQACLLYWNKTTPFIHLLTKTPEKCVSAQTQSWNILTCLQTIQYYHLRNMYLGCCSINSLPCSHLNHKITLRAASPLSH